MRLIARFIGRGFAALLFVGTASAVINPALQPDVYFQKYDNVVVLKIDAIHADAGELNCSVVKAIKGDYAPATSVRVVFKGALSSQVAERAADGSLAVGDEFPVFAGKPSRRKSKRQVRVYADEFLVGEVIQPNEFHIGVATEMETDSEGGQVNTLAGIYCGMTSQLIKMLEDLAADRAYYPRKAYVKFKPDLLVDELPGSIEGAAMFDINGDGMEDLIACSPKGDRIYFQVEPMKFSNVTEKLGVTSASLSCSVADVDCDGLLDLMLGTTIYKGVFDKTYKLEKTDWLRVADMSGFKSASFVELNGDGYPDVVASFAGRGLRAFLNPGKEKRVYTDASKAMELPAEGDGYFFPGDWNGDHRADLFYAVGRGALLVQDEKGVFAPVAHEVAFSFKTGMDEIGKTGAGVFMTSYKPDQMDLVVPIEKDWLIIANEAGAPTDITMYGNEISEGSDYHFATAAADLNVDGYVDIYTICDQRKENRYIINRGYGSYMHAKVHVDEKPLFKGPAHGAGGRSLALGDINNDGAPDILVGNEQGQLFLIVNDTLSMRVKSDLMKSDEKRLLNTRLCSVRVLGPKGVVGAKVRVVDAAGAVVARRDVGGNVTSGCSSPDQICFAVRAPGKYTVKVDYSDGHQREFKVDLTTAARMAIVAERGDQEGDNAGW